MNVFIQKIEKHCHRLSCCSGFIKKGSIGKRKSCKIADYSLKIQKTFKPSLGNFCLVRGILRVPSGVFKNIPEDHTWSYGIVITLSNIIFKQLIFKRYFLNVFKKLVFTHGRWKIKL